MNSSNAVLNRRILVIDDNPAIHDDFRKILESRPSADREFLDAKNLLFGESSAGITAEQFRIDSAFQGADGVALVREALAAGDPYSLAFIDIRMPPGWDGIETIGRIWAIDPKLQVVICSAYSDYSWEQITERLGNSDNFVILKKPFDNIEVVQLAHALTTKWELAREVETRLNNLDRLVLEKTRELHAANLQLQTEIRDKVLAEEALRLSEERFSGAFHSSPVSMSIQNFRTGRFIEVNERFVEMSGYSREELINPDCEVPEIWQPAPGLTPFWELLRETGRVRDFNCRLRTKAGELRAGRVFAQLLHLASEPLVLVITEDVSEQVRMESQLRQAQKMEAIGQLAAGIAHDFNNHLTLILGHLSLVLAAKSFEPEIDQSIRQAFRAGEKAGTLTRQLLAFSRKQVMERQAIKLPSLFRELESLLQRVIGEQIRVHFETDPDLPPVYADPCNLEQVILNLTLNARDAMPDGGELRIGAETVHLDEQAIKSQPDGGVGTFVRLTVSDTGCGMDEITKSRLFEPFFTTKEKGKGTGMGLATVYGIIKQHQGWISVESQPGAGTTFSIFLPPASEHMENRLVDRSSGPSDLASIRGSETILVVEDEELIRELVQNLLQGQGYKTLLACDGVEALRVWQECRGKVDLLLTDLVMPNGINGKDLAIRLTSEKPDLKVVFTSGYSLDVLGRDLDTERGNWLLQKPYQPALLLETIRKCLDAHEPNGSKVINNRWSKLGLSLDR